MKNKSLLSIITAFLISISFMGCFSNRENNKTNNDQKQNDYIEQISENKNSVSSSESVTVVGKKYEYKVTEYSDGDSNVLYWNIDIQKDSKDIQKIAINVDRASSVKPDAKRLIQLQDVNFDGNEDLLVWKGNYGVSNSSAYICYLCTEDDMYPFEVMEGFELISNPSIDKGKKLILGSNRENASTYDYTTYKVQDNKLVKDSLLEVVHKENTLSDCTVYKYDEDEKNKIKEENNINFQERYTKDGYFDIGSISWTSFGDTSSCTDNQCD